MGNVFSQNLAFHNPDQKAQSSHNNFVEFLDINVAL
jgi:hypothetical protein